MTHFTRLIELTSADEAYVSALASTLAPCILRPRNENSMTMEEKYAGRLIRDLFAHKEPIFTELKRASSLNHSGTVTQRPRAISTDESNRKANVEARNRAILAGSHGPASSAAGTHPGSSRSRATSPAPSPRGHRRDRSSGGPETRFPISTSATTSPTDTRDTQSTPTRAQRFAPSRGSLDVPTPTSATAADATDSQEPAGVPALSNITNGTTTGNRPPSVVSVGATYVPDGTDDLGHIEKRNSLGRMGAARSSVGRRGAPPRSNRMSTEFGSTASSGVGLGLALGKRDSNGSMGKRDSTASLASVTAATQGDEDGARRGVSLTDRAMDD